MYNPFQMPPRLGFTQNNVYWLEPVREFHLGMLELWEPSNVRQPQARLAYIYSYLRTMNSAHGLLLFDVVVIVISGRPIFLSFNFIPYPQRISSLAPCRQHPLLEAQTTPSSIRITIVTTRVAISVGELSSALLITAERLE